VTISGLIDYAYAQQGGTMAGVKGTTVSTNLGTSATSVIRFIAVEDLGGGMRATAQYNLDPRAIANDGSSSLNRDEVFVGVSGGFGNIRLGSPNSITLGNWLTASALGTGVGSVYVGHQFGLTAVPRYNRSVRYDSPRMGGLTLSALYAPGNDEAATASAAANGIPNSRATTELGAAYTQGALNVNIAQRSAPAASFNASPFSTRAANGAVWYDTHAATATAYGKSDFTSISANYKIGATTLYVGMNDGKTVSATLAANAVATKGNILAVRHDMGAISLIAQMGTQKTGADESKATGLRADYALSKRSAAYVGYENLDNGKTSANTRKIASVGVRHSF
jgi:predicted porin